MKNLNKPYKLGINILGNTDRYATTEQFDMIKDA